MPPGRVWPGYKKYDKGSTSLIDTTFAVPQLVDKGFCKSASYNLILVRSK